MNIGYLLSKIGFCVKLLCILVLFRPVEALPFQFADWSRGAEGYDDALWTAKRQKEPLIVYFRTEWCGWCKKLDERYLSSPAMMSFLEDIPKVEIDPDKGREERRVKNEYRVSGYPTFLVCLPSFDGRPSRVSPFRKGGALGVGDFIGEIKKRISNLYNRKGYSLHKAGTFEKAVESYRRSIKYNPGGAKAHYYMGMAYDKMARRKLDGNLLEKARKSYLKALEIDPDHQKSTAALARLEKYARTIDLDDSRSPETATKRKIREPDAREEAEARDDGPIRSWVDENGVRHYTNY